MALGPFDLSGGPFLILYAALFLLACLASARLSHALRPEGRRPLNLPPDDAAVLAGGLPRHSEMVAMQLLATGHLAVDAKHHLVLAADAPATPVVTALRVLPQPLQWHRVDRALAGLGQAIRARLTAQGLLMTEGEGWRVRIAQAAPFVLLACFGLVKLAIGEARGRPVGFLTIALIVTVVVAVVRLAGLDQRTRAGRVAVAAACARHARLRRAPTGAEAALGVALFGTSILIGSGWEVLHRLRTAGGDGGASIADGGSSDGGSGGSGGGCGGCGGGGCGGCSS